MALPSPYGAGGGVNVGQKTKPLIYDPRVQSLVRKFGQTQNLGQRQELLRGIAGYGLGYGPTTTPGITRPPAPTGARLEPGYTGTAAPATPGAPQLSQITGPVSGAVQKEIGFTDQQRAGRVKALTASLQNRTTESSRRRALQRILAQGGLQVG